MISKSLCCMVVVGVLAGMLVGCGGIKQKGPATVEVSGTVTFDGKPLPTGRIIFRPAEGVARSYAGEIKDGKFSFQCEPGKKKVEITAEREVKVDPKTLSIEEQVQLESEGKTTVTKQYIPARYNSKTTLTAEVTESGPNTFTFELKSGE